MLTTHSCKHLKSWDARYYALGKEYIVVVVVVTHSYKLVMQDHHDYELQLR